MNSRLMKYMASTSPTVRKKYWRAFDSTSGWRAIAAMVCEPARPSPTAAPMAPPPSARPPPTSAPAVRIAVSVELDIGVSLCWSVFFGRRHADVHDREQREDQCLDRDDEEGVERLPHEAPEPGGDRAHDGVAHDD